MPAAKEAAQRLIDLYEQSEIAEADFIVAVGGDGTTLKALHAVLPMPEKPVFAMRLPDSVGALTNPYSIVGLKERMCAARKVFLSPLQATAQRVNGGAETVVGVNDIVVSRQRLQAAKLQVSIGEMLKACRIVGDGVLICTPIGSTGYNQSAGGPTLMTDSHLLAVTGLAVRRPGEWTSTVVNDHTVIEIEVFDPVYRPVRIETILQEVREVSSVRISSSHDKTITLLREDRPHVPNLSAT